VPRYNPDMALTLLLPPAELAAEFTALADRWTRETQHISNPTHRILHRDYQRIIGLGAQVVPLVLRRLRDQPEDWFWALRALTGHNPIKAEHTGKVRPMIDDWLEWARDNGIEL
jgi:hypothetical protein